MLLPRISAALSEFVTPIVSKAAKPVEPGQASQFRRFEPEKQKPPPDSKGETSPDQGERPPDQPDQLARVIPIQRNTKPEKDTGVASTLVQLLALFKEHQGILIKLLGRRSYAAAEKKQKKALIARKGAILDRRAE